MKNLVRVTALPKLPARPAESHKGDFGKLCVIAASRGFSGAAAIAGRAALRSGAGLVRVAVPGSVLPIVASIEPCFTTIPLAEDSLGRISAAAAGTVLQAAAENDVTAIGPGLGVSSGVKSVIEKLLHIEKLRLVIDADGLNNLAKLINWQLDCRADVILTPHAGEMRRIWPSLWREPIPPERILQAARLASKANAVVVLKGNQTLVSDTKRYYLNDTGNPGMATAGAGDVLTGVIAALAGQGLDNFDAAVLGVYVHGLAGDIAVKNRGQLSLIATDIIDSLGDAFKMIQ